MELTSLEIFTHKQKVCMNQKLDNHEGNLQKLEGTLLASIP
jgi:hypothetical protein